MPTYLIIIVVGRRELVVDESGQQCVVRQTTFVLQLSFGSNGASEVDAPAVFRAFFVLFQREPSVCATLA